MAAILERSDIRRQGIVDAAVALADSTGLDAVTMRGVAERLGVGTMTLYSYVADKDELLDLMADEVSREMLVPEPLPAHWRDALAAIARRTRDAVDRHPWIFEARPPRRRRHLNTMRHIEQSLTSVASLGVDGPKTAAILMAVDDYTLGHAVQKHARERMRGDHAAGRHGAPPTDPAVEAALEAGELPLLREHASARSHAEFGVRPESDFEQGLQWLLDGIDAPLSASDPRRPPRP